ncbi:UbiA family prenyltransferase [Ideonella azotifigens]|uniref:UbiA family prenyltransferase n=1 Tax=Ideonella azotifigens TaxID=513160 RepID=A0ABN1KHC9_9BURK
MVDLDGTLLRTDTLIESLFGLARQKPLQLLALPAWLLGGRAGFKQRLARAAEIDISTMPVDEDVLAHLQAQRRQGRRLVLATAADERVATAAARRFGLFDQVLASNGQTNLSAERKRDRLVAEFGPRGFDYLGDSDQDLPVWAQARRALLVRPSHRCRVRAARVAEIEQTFADGRPGIGDYLHAMRISHWLKNLLVLLPLLVLPALAGAMMGKALLAFVAFSLSASGVYLLNDLFDLQADRAHPHKRQRALASGRVPLLHGLLLVPVLWGLALGLAVASASPLPWVLAGYTLLMVAYSMWLKHLAYLDAAVLGLGYSLRLLAGALAIGAAPAPGLLACCAVYFFGLALLKRYAELIALGHRVSVHGQVRGYPVNRRRQLWLVGVLASTVPIALLLAMPRQLALPARATAGWLGCVLLLAWTGHMWRMARAGRIEGDPVAYAVRDMPSRLLAALAGALLLAVA